MLIKEIYNKEHRVERRVLNELEISKYSFKFRYDLLLYIGTALLHGDISNIPAKVDPQRVEDYIFFGSGNIINSDIKTVNTIKGISEYYIYSQMYNSEVKFLSNGTATLFNIRYDIDYNNIRLELLDVIPEVISYIKRVLGDWSYREQAVGYESYESYMVYWHDRVINLCKELGDDLGKYRKAQYNIRCLTNNLMSYMDKSSENGAIKSKVTVSSNNGNNKDKITKLESIFKILHTNILIGNIICNSYKSDKLVFYNELSSYIKMLNNYKHVYYTQFKVKAFNYLYSLCKTFNNNILYIIHTQVYYELLRILKESYRIGIIGINSQYFGYLVTEYETSIYSYLADIGKMDIDSQELCQIDHNNNLNGIINMILEHIQWIYHDIKK